MELADDAAKEMGSELKQKIGSLKWLRPPLKLGQVKTHLDEGSNCSKVSGHAEPL